MNKIITCFNKEDIRDTKSKSIGYIINTKEDRSEHFIFSIAIQYTEYLIKLSYYT